MGKERSCGSPQAATTTGPGERIVDIVGYLGDITPTAPAADQARATVSSLLASLLVSDRTQADAGTTAGVSATSNLPTEAEAISIAIRPQTDRYTYNNRGDLTAVTAAGASQPTAAYGWNQADQLTSYTGATGTTTYAYNGNGLRTSKTEAGTTQHFVYDPTAPTPEILAAGSTSYIYGPSGLPLEQVGPNGTTLWYHHDQQGSTRLLTTAAGTVAGSATYSPYGSTVATSGTATPLGYAGAWTDGESGLLYLINRYYNPETAQFLSVDPEAAATNSRYKYVADNPVNGIDPLGLCDSNPFSGGFWSNGNCLSGLVGGPDGGGGESIHGVINSIAGLAGAVAGSTAIVLGGGELIVGAYASATGAETVFGVASSDLVASLGSQATTASVIAALADVPACFEKLAFDNCLGAVTGGLSGALGYAALLNEFDTLGNQVTGLSALSGALRIGGMGFGLFTLTWDVGRGVYEGLGSGASGSGGGQPC